jgi:adenosine deaminase
MQKTDYSKIPKVEFHRHLDGSVRTQTIHTLAKKFKIDLGFDLDDEQLLISKTKVLKPLSSLDEVLGTFWTTQKVMANEEAMEQVAYENVEDLKHDGVVLGELRFAPVFIAQNKDLSIFSYDAIIESTLRGIDRAVRDFSIPVGLIHICPRSLPMTENLAATERILHFKKHHSLGKYLVGIDLADSETTTNPKDFTRLIEMGREVGLGVTIHSGEDSSAEHMKTTLKVFDPDRFGHGIRAIDDAGLMRQLIEAGKHLEVCPTSNWLTRSVETLESHPFIRLWRQGVSVSLNSDDPHLMGIDLVHEYRVAREILGVTEQEFHDVNKQALAHSFLPEDQKRRVLENYFRGNA